MDHRRRFTVALWATVLLFAGLSQASGTPSVRPLVWTTLGTDSGPFIKTDRSQPANMMLVNGKPWLIDCGAGTVERLAATGHQAAQVDVVFLSHVHIDHIAGLEGLIGLRWMGGAHTAITIYGPPGTDVVVAGLLQSMKPASLIVNSASDVQNPPPDALVKVVIVRDGSDLTVDGVRVRAVRNTHFDKPPGHSLNPSTESLSYRFDKDGYSVGYTGDTGPSDAVAKLEQGADLLISEVIDLPSIIADAEARQPNMTASEKATLTTHLITQHLTPEEAGRIATAAHIRRLVFTHLAIVGPTNMIAPRLIAGARTTFGGEVEVAHDLDTF